MKKSILFALVLLLTSTVALASDVMVLTNGMTFEGEIKRVRSCDVLFKAANGERYWVPGHDISGIAFGDVTSRTFRQYVEMSHDTDACMAGKLDAKHLHGISTTYFAAGCFLTWVGVILAAVSNPGIEDGELTMEQSANEHLFDDPDYLRCYTEQARKQNVKSSVGGTIISSVVWIAGYVVGRLISQ